MSITKFAMWLFVALGALAAAPSIAHAQTFRAPQPRPMRSRPTRTADVAAPVWAGTGQRAGAAGNYVADELLVRFADGAALKTAAALHAQTGATVLRQFTLGNWQLLRLPKTLAVAAAQTLYAQTAGVVAVQPNYVYHLAATPNDPRFGEQYGPVKISAPAAWDVTTGSSNVVVAVIDTGIKYTHPDLSANMWRNPGETGLDAQGRDKTTNGVDDDGNGYVDDVYGIDTANNDSDPLDDYGHGTHVAGIVGAVGNNGVGVVGVNWNVRLLAVKMFDATGNGTTATAIAAFQYVVMMHGRGVNVRLTNNSWGGAPEAAAADQALKDAMDAAGQAGILNICAAGNGNSNNDPTPFYPASYDSATILSVAASDNADARAGFSNYGATSVDLAAPGVSILSTVIYTGDYGYLSGTSMAAPMTAGAAALVLAEQPGLSAESLKTTLLNSVDVLPQWSGLCVSGGRLNVARALQQASTCAFDVTPGHTDFAAAGGPGTCNVAATAGCNWTAVSHASWLTINANAAGYGNGAVGYTVAANTGPARTATLLIAGRLLSVAQAAGQAPPDPPPTPPAAGQVLISEFRLDGPNGPDDQFVELYNNTNQPLTVATDDGSPGWALVSATGAGGTLATVFVIPNGTNIPPRGHYLYANPRGYSLAAYGAATGAAPDATGPAAAPAASAQGFACLALFRSAAPANWTQANRLDAVGSTQAPTLLREGAGLPYEAGFTSDAQYSWARVQGTGLPQDTDDNAQDFALVSTRGVLLGGVRPQLGAPGPENLASPIQRNATLKALLVDPTVLSTTAPNRVRDPTTNACGGPNCQFGTLIIRRRFRNSTGQPVTALRFRIVDVTTLGTPNPGGAQADVRALDSVDVSVQTSTGPVAVKGTTVEQPPAQVFGGGLNTTLTVALPGGALAPGAAVNVQFALGVQSNGRFRFLINVESLP